MRDSTRLDGRPTRRERESAQSERRSPLVSISSLVDHLLERDGARGSNRSVSCVSSSRRRLGRTGKDDDEDEDEDEDDDDDDDDEDEGEGWTVETGRADDGGVARWGDEARGERRGRARGERRGRARGVRVGDGDDRDRGRVRGAIGATEIGG